MSLGSRGAGVVLGWVWGSLVSNDRESVDAPGKARLSRPLISTGLHYGDDGWSVGQEGREVPPLEQHQGVAEGEKERREDRTPNNHNRAGTR